MLFYLLTFSGLAILLTGAALNHIAPKKMACSKKRLKATGLLLLLGAVASLLLVLP